MVSKHLTIESVVENDLCVSCGNCEAVCPHRAITLEWVANKGYFIPSLDNSICTHCGLCYEACPGAGLNTKSLAESFLNFDEPKFDPIVGDYQGAYLGHAYNSELRYLGSSGGIVTGLALFALEANLVDGILTCHSTSKNPLIPEPFIATTQEEVLTAAGSKYCVIPVNRVLREVLDSPGDNRYLFIGLPCQIQGVRAVQKTHKELQEKISGTISLFCGRNYSVLATLSLLSQLDILPSEVKSLSYRTNQWPGYLGIAKSGGGHVKLNYPGYMGIRWVPETMWRCVLCEDAFGDLADISVGDNWVLQDKASQFESVVIARTKAGQNILDSACQGGALNLEKETIQAVLDSQSSLLKFKVDWLDSRIIIARLFRKAIPRLYNREKPQLSLNALVHALAFYMRRVLYRKILPSSAASVEYIE